MVTKYIQVILLASTLSLTGCELFTKPEPIIQTKIVEVKVPIPYVPETPLELKSEIDPELPKFISPSSEYAVMGLDINNSAKLKDLINTLKARVAAWEVWHENMKANNPKEVK